MFKKRYPFIKQYNLRDCGICSLAMIIKYYNGFISVNELSSMIKYNKDGISAYQLVEVSKKLGLNAYGIKLELSEYKTNIFPVIALIKTKENLNHYVVVYKIDYLKKEVVIADPASKIEIYSLEKFLKYWLNIFIVLYPVTNIVNKEDNGGLYNFYKNIFKINIKIYFKLFYISLIFILLIFTTSYYYEWIIEGINNSETYNYYLIIILTYMILYVLYNINNYIRTKLLIDLSLKTNYLLTNKVYNKLINLPYQYYYNHTTGEILNKVNEINNIEIFYINLLSFITLYLPQLLLSIIFLILFYFNLLLVIFIYIVILIIIEYIFYHKYKNYYHLYQSTKEYNTNYIKESITSYKTIKGLNLENKFYSKFLKNNLKSIYNNYKYNNTIIMHDFFKNNLKDIMFTTIVGITIVTNDITPKLIIKLFLLRTIINYTLTSLNEINNLFILYPKAKISFQKLSFLFNKNKIKDIKIDNINYIEISKLTFSYNDKLNIIDDLNLNIKAGEKILITGSTGSGKSTLLKLLMNYFRSDKGHIKYNNINITSITEESLKENITYLNQDTHLFFDTIYNNIVLKRKIEINKFIKINKICHLDKIINNQRAGFDTLIIEDGNNLSGGEKQRIALARALLNKFNVLIIDEGLSAVNNEIEYKILKDLIKCYQDKIIIVVSHKNCIKTLFDKVYNFEEGKLYECI